MAATTGTAGAVPTVKFKAAAVPIPGFRSTGNIYGGGAALAIELTIEGTEYGGYPPPLLGITISLPKGTKLRSSGLPTCPLATLESSGQGPSACPRGSIAGPPGKLLAIVARGKQPMATERVPEEATLEPFYIPGGGVALLAVGHFPASLEILAPTRYLNLLGAEGFGPQLVTEVPLVQAEPGAAAISLETLSFKLGTAYKQQGKSRYFLSVPKIGQCPKGGFLFKSELKFAAAGGPVPVTGTVTPQQNVTTSYKAPCPRRAVDLPPPPPPPPPSPPPPPPPAPATPVSGTGGAVTAPANKVCLSHRDFTIHIVQITGLTYRTVEVFVNGRRVKVVNGSAISAPVDLRGLPKGRYTVRIVVTTTTGRRVSGTRSYHTCAARPLPFHGKSPL